MKINEYIRQIIANEIETLENISVAINKKCDNLYSRFNSSSYIKSYTSNNDLISPFTARGSVILDKDLRQSLKAYMLFVNDLEKINHSDRAKKDSLQQNIKSETKKVDDMIQSRIREIKTITF